ncbi:synaptotagmin-like protein 2 isoform X6 [Cyclopterus lumpus]|uniref:synaptotagmin-like protein 2 isoform X6 n=1 Tax=Cyclopterus lumpus TaxID=8103 RepID=UPI001486587D|nr:synaptotagmin-like protein 2 isoform X6 [Cyclopterus lumpus]
MIDLSFLTEEEQETIRTVLKRDAKLKKAEEQRVQNLQKTVSDEGRLKYMTGEWFYETKQLRHQDRIHGSEIIRASMRHSYKPLTILELSQILPEKPSFVSSENKEVFVPPALSGILQQPHTQLSAGRYENQKPRETPQDAHKPVLQSPTKQRQNPFNSDVIASHSFENKDRQLLDVAVDQTLTQNKEPLPSSDSCISYASNLKQEPNDSPITQNASMPMPMPVNISSSHDSFVEEDRPGGQQTNSTAPRGILKHLSTSSNTDSLFSCLDLQSPVSLDSPTPTESWIDRKQVRFSSKAGQSGVEWQDGMELGENGLLDVNPITPSEAENNNDLEDTGRAPVGIRGPVFNQSKVDSQEGELNGKYESNLQEQEAGEHLGDVSEHFHPDILSLPMSGLISDDQESGYDDSSSPIFSALKRLSSRSTSSSKSLENLTSQTREERTQKTSREQMNQSVDNASTLSSSKQMKSSVSMTVLQQDEDESDSTLETNLGWRRNTGSSTSNLSLSSGLASISSVSGSISSLYFGDIEVQGSIQLAVNYIQKLGEFHIFVVHCRDLAVADMKNNCSDPYVKCYLLSEKTKLGKRKTTVKKKTLNPTYNEILRFKIIMEVLKTQSLNISVWQNNTFGRNSFLGEVDLDMSEWDFSNTHINEYALKARFSGQSPTASPSHLMDSRGQMRVALRFLPQTSRSKRTSRMETGEVQIWVKDCKNLPPVRGVFIDPFVKCTVLPDTSRKSRQKTRVVKRTANPMFNHTMVYDGFRSEDLREACVEITVWDHDRLSSHYIGGLRLGLGTGKSYGVEVAWMDSTTDEAHLWQRMLQSDGEWVEDALPLRTLVMAKSMSK